MTGTIKNLNERGFGFIEQEGKEDLFFHKSELKGVTFEELKAADKDKGTKGDTVTFDIKEGEPGGKGPSAINVSRA